MLVHELRAAVDIARMAVPLVSAALSRRQRSSHGPHVIVVPGYGADDRVTRPLRTFLKYHGYSAEGWHLGRNLAGLNLRHGIGDLSPHWQVEAKSDYRGEGGVPFLADRLAERVVAIHEAHGEPVCLVGWSLGGYLAREAARDLPQIVDRVITLGSPIVGGPKYTASASSFRKRGLDLDWIEREILRREIRPIEQPVTAIYSKTDAIVSWPAAIDRFSPRVEHVEIDCSHLGMVFNPTVWGVILRSLRNEPVPRPERRIPATPAE